MNCPKCGNEIGEGKLICEKCGHEVKLVSDFEFEIENKIQESSLASSVRDILNDEFDNNQSSETLKEDDINIEDDELFKDDDELDNDEFWDVEEVIKFSKEHFIIKKLSGFFGKSTLNKIIVSVCVLVCLALVVTGTVICVRSVRNSSNSYQFKMAQKAYNKGDVEGALDYLEKAISIDSTDVNQEYMLADLYIEAGRDDEALSVYKDLLFNNGELTVSGYGKMFSLYEKKGEISTINEMLSNCDNSEVVETYDKYRALEPEFSEKAGEFYDVVYLKMTANTSGKIYYTLDGSEPDINSNEYTAPVCLDSGTFFVKAVFVNDYGVMSPVSMGQYVIYADRPAAPIMTPDEGSYSNAPMVCCTNMEDGLELYYTTDGSTPTRESKQLTGPLFMPIGKTQFTFMFIRYDDVCSETTVLTYQSNVSGAVINAETARQTILNFRYTLGNLADLDGNLSNVNGKLVYICDSSVGIGGANYYVVTEYFQDNSLMTLNPTGLYYAVCASAPEIYGFLEFDEYLQPYVRR